MMKNCDKKKVIKQMKNLPGPHFVHDMAPR